MDTIEIPEVIETDRIEQLLQAAEQITGLAVATGDPSLQQHLDILAILRDLRAEEDDRALAYNPDGTLADFAWRDAFQLRIEQVQAWHLDRLARHLNLGFDPI